MAAAGGIQVRDKVRSVRASFEIKTILFLGIVLTLGFAILYPFVLLIFQSFTITATHEPTRYGFATWQFALSDPGMLKSLWNTVYLTVVRQGIAFPIAIVITWLITRTDMPGGKWLEFLFWMAFFMPTVPVVQAWILLTHPSAGLFNNAINSTLDWLPFVGSFDRGPFNIYSFWGIVWVHLVTNTIGIKIMLMAPAFRNMDAALEDASRISGAGSMRTLARVTIPVLTPAILTMILLTFFRAAQASETDILLGIPIGFFVFSSKIFNLFKAEPPQYNAAAAMGITVLAAILPVILLHTWYIRRRRYTTITGQYQPQKLHLRQWRWPIFSIVMTLALVSTLVPTIFLTMGTFMKLFGFFEVPGGPWTMANWERVLNDRVFIRSVKNTIYLGLGSACLASVFFTMVAYIVVRTKSRFRSVLDIMVWIPYVMPGIILALAWLIITLNTAFLKPLYGSMFLMIMVTSLGGITAGVQLVKANLMQQGLDMEEASAVSGAGWFRTFTRIVLPLLAPMIVVVWVLNFVSAVGGAIIPAFLATPQTRPLALLQFEHVMSGQYEEATVVGVIVLALTIVVAVLARTAGFRVGLGRTERKAAGG